jgi:hypothetical protein
MGNCRGTSKWKKVLQACFLQISISLKIILIVFRSSTINNQPRSQSSWQKNKNSTNSKNIYGTKSFSNESKISILPFKHLGREAPPG